MNAILHTAREYPIQMKPISPMHGYANRRDVPMKYLTDRLFSFLKQGSGFLPRLNSKMVADQLISAYDFSAGDDSPAELMRKPVGILYADVAEYTRLTELDEEGTHQRLVECMGIVRAHVIANNGRISHFAGDAILVEFKDADSALHCAISIQLSARQWNHGLNPDHQIRFRIGVNFGEVISDQGDIFGKAVNLAARLENLAQTGGICVSQSARDNLRDNSKVSFFSLGKRYLKNLNEPVEAFWIEIDGEHLVNSISTGSVKVSGVAS